MTFVSINRHRNTLKNNFEEKKITADQLASMFALGRRNMERRF